MASQQLSIDTYRYQTVGSCALAPQAYPHLRLVTDAEVSALGLPEAPVGAAGADAPGAGPGFVSTAQRASAPEAIPETAAVASPSLRECILAGLALITVVVALAVAMAFVETRNARLLARAWEQADFEETIVRQGDTLWSLAGEHGVAGIPTEDVVDEIMRRNGLTESLIRPGERLLVPRAEAAMA